MWISRAHLCFFVAVLWTADARLFTGNVFADNWVRLWVNGKEIYTDPVSFIPHNVVSFEFEDGE